MNDRRNPSVEQPAGGDPERPAGDRVSLYISRMSSPDVVKARQTQRQAQTYASRGIVAFGRRPARRAARQRKTIVASVAALTSLIGGGGAALAAQSVHQIQPGDTLSQLADTYGSTVDELATLNGISDPDLIITGNSLVIPADGSVSATTASGASYTIVWGDTLSDIAESHGTSVDALATLNGIDDPDQIVVDDVLNLPAGGSAVSDQSAANDDSGDGVDADQMSDDADDGDTATAPVDVTDTNDTGTSSDTTADSDTSDTSAETDDSSSDSVDASSDDQTTDTGVDSDADDGSNDATADDSDADDGSTDTTTDDTSSDTTTTDSGNDQTDDTTDSEDGTTETAPAPAPVDVGIQTLHLVTEGETLESIADQYGISVDALLAVNTQATDGVAPGMILAIPDGASNSVQLVGVPVVIADSADATETGAVAAATGYWGAAIPQEDTAAALEDSDSPVDAVSSVLERYTYHAGVFDSSSGTDTLQAQLDAGIPVIVWLASDTGTHAVVVYGYDDTGAFILDPADGSTARFAWDDFVATWNAAGGEAVAVALA